MRRILAMLRVSVIQVVRDRGELISMLVLPILLTYVFGVAFGSQGAERAVKIAWIAGDSSSYASQIEKLVDDDDSVEVERMTEDEARAALDDGLAALAVSVPVGFGEALEAGRQATIEVTQEPGSSRARVAVEIVQGAAARVSANVQAARVTRDMLEAHRFGGAAPPGTPAYGGFIQPRYSFSSPSQSELYETADSLWEPEPPIAVTGTRVTASEVRGDSVLAGTNEQYSIGFTIMFVMFMAFGSAGGILEEREQGTLRRLLIAPAPRAQILGGKVAGVIGTSALEATILVGLGALAFGVPWGRDPLALLLVLGAYIFASAGLAVFITAVVRTRSQLSAIGPIASTGLAMLGGCYWPIEITPPFMQTIAKFTPTGWGMAGLLDVVSRGQGIEAALQPAGVLLLMAAVAFGAGLYFLKVD